MLELLHYFEPVDNGLTKSCDFFNKSALGKNICINTSNKPITSLDSFKIALFGVMEDRGSFNTGSAIAPDHVRRYLYSLSAIPEVSKIADLGNLKQGKTLNDTYLAIRDICFELISNEIVPVIIGGSQDLTYALFLAYEKLEHTINIVSVDPRFDIGDVNDPVSSINYFSKIISSTTNHLFNITNLGYQTYYVSMEETDLMKNILFDYHRLGALQANISEAEPCIRDASIVTFDISSIKQSDAPGHAYPSPNGFTGKEACIIARYSGISDKVSSFGLFDINPEFDSNGQTSHLAAQIVWHFLEGYFLRKNDFPVKNIKDYKKIIVKISDADEIVFYTNLQTDRWWMEIPYKKANYDKSMIIACSYEDYNKACNQEVPDRWWKTFQKIC